MLFRTGAKGDAAHVPRDATPIFFPEKENGRRPSKRKAFRLAVSILNGLYASGMEVPARGVAALVLLYDLACFYYPLPLCPSCRSTQ